VAFGWLGETCASPSSAYRQTDQIACFIPESGHISVSAVTNLSWN